MVGGGAAPVNPGGRATGDPVAVEITYGYEPLFPRIKPLTLKVSTTMRYEVVGS